VEIAAGDSMTLGMVLVVLRRAEPPSWKEGSRAVRAPSPGPEVVIQAPAMLALYKQVSLAARGLISVLLLGETGAGKEVLARTVHERSPRAHRPFLGLNCAALSASLLEAELFGHEKGAFTGAHESRPGLFEAAEGGTVFLDEIGELPTSVQMKLLRVIEERKVLRVGGRSPRAIDARFVSATNRDLEAEVARGAFRQDLYFRLNGITLTIPPLRSRRAEIAPLAHQFIVEACRRVGREPLAMTDNALKFLEGQSWPGNIRELKNSTDRAVTLCTGDIIDVHHLAPIESGFAPNSFSGAPTENLHAPIPASPPTTPDLAPPPADVSLYEDARRAARDLERRRIAEAMERCGGNQTRAAQLLRISRRTLVARLTEYGFARPLKDRRSD
jgi:DNA-binding NtrC family response regulator